MKSRCELKGGREAQASHLVGGEGDTTSMRMLPGWGKGAGGSREDGIGLLHRGSWGKCQIIQFTVATYNTNSPFEVQSKLIHDHDLWHKAQFVQYVHRKQILGNSNQKNKK